ncbi:MAG: hypothetical protein WBG92_02280 [Thiohalocapsa sp.]
MRLRTSWAIAIHDARVWLTAFISHYQHRPHEGVTFYSPADVFEGRVEAILARRQAAPLPANRTPNKMPIG